MNPIEFASKVAHWIAVVSHVMGTQLEPNVTRAYHRERDPQGSLFAEWFHKDFGVVVRYEASLVDGEICHEMWWNVDADGLCLTSAYYGVVGVCQIHDIPWAEGSFECPPVEDGPPSRFDSPEK